jgi:hypothetical protein
MFIHTIAESIYAYTYSCMYGCKEFRPKLHFMHDMHLCIPCIHAFMHSVHTCIYAFHAYILFPCTIFKTHTYIYVYTYIYIYIYIQHILLCLSLYSRLYCLCLSLYSRLYCLYLSLYSRLYCLYPEFQAWVASTLQLVCVRAFRVCM